MKSIHVETITNTEAFRRKHKVKEWMCCINEPKIQHIGNENGKVGDIEAYQGERDSWQKICEEKKFMAQRPTALI